MYFTYLPRSVSCFVLQEKLEHKVEETQYVMDQRLKKLEQMIIAEGERLTEMQQVCLFIPCSLRKTLIHISLIVK